MKLHPFLKIPALIFLALSSLLLTGAGGLWLLYSFLPEVDFLSSPGVSFQITVQDWEGNVKPFTVGPENPFWISLSRTPEHLQKAILAGEDFSFYRHKGVDWFEVKESFLKNIETRSFARGASTISQQLAKNLFLSREKTLTRKLREVLLAWKLEKTLKKDRILELYLNIVELGDMVYGIGQGSWYHFGKEPSGLSLRESTILAAMLPGPKVYDPARHPNRVMNRSDHLLGVMLKGKMIDEGQYLYALDQLPFAEEPPPIPAGFFKPEVDNEEKEAPAGKAVAQSERSLFEAGPEPIPVPIQGETAREQAPEGVGPQPVDSEPSFALTPPGNAGPAVFGETDSPNEPVVAPE